jgi:hypothetical protein
MSRGPFRPPQPLWPRIVRPLSGRTIPGRSDNLVSAGSLVGGAGRDRTGDLRVANAALSQLSYSPRLLWLVGLSGFEPLTSRLSGVRSKPTEL